MNCRGSYESRVNQKHARNAPANLPLERPSAIQTWLLGRSRQELAERDQIGIGVLAKPFPFFHEFLPEIAEMGDGAAEGDIPSFRNVLKISKSGGALAPFVPCKKLRIRIPGKISVDGRSYQFEEITPSKLIITIPYAKPTNNARSGRPWPHPLQPRKNRGATLTFRLAVGTLVERTTLFTVWPRWKMAARPQREHQRAGSPVLAHKGSDLSVFSQAELDAIAWKLNTRPRKSLGCKCPVDVHARRF